MSDEIHPAIATMSHDEVAVLAGFARGLVLEDESSPFDAMSNPELASSLLRLQETGFLTLGVDEEDNPYVLLNKDSEKAKREYEQRQSKVKKAKKRKRRSW